MSISNIVKRGINKRISSVFQRHFQTTPAIMVKVGDTIPNVDLYEDLPTNKVNLAELASGKKLIVFAVPGAFTPGCSKTHLPGYVQKADELKQQGVNEIVCVSVNDPFVMSAWAESQNTRGKIRLLADPSAALAKALDLTVDIAPLGGVRSKRYSMVVENGKITSLQVEPDGTGLSCSLADKIKFDMNLSKHLVKVARTSKPVYETPLRNCSSNPQQPTVTILNASTKIGRTLALLLKQSPYLGELRLYDKNISICTVGEDLSHIDTRAKVKTYGGKTAMKYAVLDAHVVVAVGGCRTSHKETPKDLFDKNVDDLRYTTLHMVEFNPKAVFCIGSPPIEALVPLVSEEYKKAGVYDSRKIIGITSVASMRANSYVAAAIGKNASDVLCPIVGGVSPNCLVGVLSQINPNTGLSAVKKQDKLFNFYNLNAFLLQQVQTSIQNQLGNSEDDLLKLYADCGTICYSPALAISRFINFLLRALMGDSTCVDYAFVRQMGHIGQFLPYMASIVRLGRNGIMSSHMPKVSGDEGRRLKIASYVIRDLITLGESFVTGEVKPLPEKHFKCNLQPAKGKEKHEQANNENLSRKMEVNKIKQ
ncbi:hypothetical protein NQ315_002148 [Exocentrus adspersus]|uniref:Peroxiredoxin-5, mitochondrial n=1 Tax=Exocentrus adspersus TaxID=1586481 RepID=A0AAV8VZW7_9CUCU|nr:hypothetical protein NQ315_002148 [Exocentrus adspersus]